MHDTHPQEISIRIRTKILAHLDLQDIRYGVSENNYAEDRHGKGINQFKLSVDFNQETFKKEIILNEEGYKELEKDFLHAFREHAMTYYELPVNKKVEVF